MGESYSEIGCTFIVLHSLSFIHHCFGEGIDYDNLLPDSSENTRRYRERSVTLISESINQGGVQPDCYDLTTFLQRDGYDGWLNGDLIHGILNITADRENQDWLLPYPHHANYLVPKYCLALLPRAWPEEVHQLLSENRFTYLELGPGRISLPSRLQDNGQITMLILVAFYPG
jgi:hypothetical protein